MNSTFFRQLHETHLRIRDLQGGSEQAGKSLKRLENKVQLQEKALHDAQEHLKHLKVTIHDKEGSIKDTQQKIKKHKKQMDEAKEPKEYRALQTEIDNENQAIRVLEDEILEHMAELEEKNKELPAYEKNLQLARDEVRRAQEESAGKQTALNERLGGVQQELAALIKQLSNEVRIQYQRLLTAYGPDCLASAENRTCAGCYTELTPQGYNDLRAGRVVACKNCGRLLYI